MRRKPGPLIAEPRGSLLRPKQQEVRYYAQQLVERDGEPDGGHPGPAPHQHRPPQLLLLPQRSSQAAIRGGEGVGGGDGDGEAGHQGGAQPARVPPLRARRPPVAQVSCYPPEPALPPLRCARAPR